MHVIVLTKRKWITIMVVAILILLLIGAGIWLLIKSQNDDTAVPTMAHVDSYELQMIPYTAKEVPVYSVNRDDNAIALTIDAAWDADKTASILDIFTCIMQGLLPYGAQFLLVASLSEGRVSPMDVIPKNWYLFLLAGFTLLSFFVPAYEKFTLKGKWDWNKNRVVDE